MCAPTCTRLRKPDIIGPSGPVDPGLSVIAATTPDGSPIAFLANYSQHYYSSPLLSADYFGSFARAIARHLGQLSSEGPFVAMMSQGTSGDLMWMDYGSPKKDGTHEQYAEEVAPGPEAWNAIEWHDPSAGRGRTGDQPGVARPMPIGSRGPGNGGGAERGGSRPQPDIYAHEAIYLHERQRTDLKLQAIRIGDLTIATLPNEVYAITGLKLKRQAPLGMHFNIELANGSVGYIPRRAARPGGYTTLARAPPPGDSGGAHHRRDAPGRHGGGNGRESKAARRFRKPLQRNRDTPESIVLLAAERNTRTHRAQHGPRRAGCAACRRRGALPARSGQRHGLGRWRAPAPIQLFRPGRNQPRRALREGRHARGGSSRIARPVHPGAVVLARRTFGRQHPRWRAGHPALRRSASLHGRRQRLTVDLPRRADDPAARYGRKPHAHRRLASRRLVGDGAALHCYIDGDQDEPEAIRVDAEPFTDGTWRFAEGLEGKLDEIALFDRALNAEERRALWDASGIEADRAQPPALSSPPLPAEGLASIRVPEGYTVDLVACEPNVIDPVAFDWDTRGGSGSWKCPITPRPRRHGVGRARACAGGPRPRRLL